MIIVYHFHFQALLLDPANDAEALSIIEKYMKSYPFPVFDVPTGRQLIRVLNKTSQWKSTLHLQELQKTVDFKNARVCMLFTYHYLFTLLFVP